MKSANTLRWRGIGIALSAAIFITACGGGGDGGPPVGGGPSPTPTASPSPEPTPTGSPTPTPTGSPTPTPTGSPTPTPTGSPTPAPLAFDPAVAAALDASTPGVTPSTDEAKIAMDAQGNATVVWIQTDGTRQNVFARRFNATTQTFEDQKLIGVKGGGAARRVSLTVNANGDAVAIWTQSDGNTTSEEIDVMAAVYTGGNWLPAKVVAAQSNLPGVANTSQPLAAFGPDGMIVAVWRSVLSGLAGGEDRDQIQSATYDPVQKTWGLVQEVDSSLVRNLLDPRVVVLPNKDALIVFITQEEANVSSAGIRIYRKKVNSDNWLPGNVEPSSGAEIVTLFNAPDGNTADLQLAANEAGQVQIVWTHTFVDVTGGRNAILTAFLPAGSNIWSAPIVADITAGDPQSTDGKLGKSSREPNIVMDKNGKSTIAWLQDNLYPNTGNIQSLYAIQFDITQKKFDSDKPFLVEDSEKNMQGGAPSALSVNASGNVFALWEQLSVVAEPGVTQRMSAYASQFDATTKTWSKPAVVEADESVSTAGDLGIAIAPNNTAVAVWKQTNRVMFNRFK